MIYGMHVMVCSEVCNVLTILLMVVASLMRAWLPFPPFHRALGLYSGMIQYLERQWSSARCECCRLVHYCNCCGDSATLW